jgi:hypothetical protein
MNHLVIANSQDDSVAYYLTIFNYYIYSLKQYGKKYQCYRLNLFEKHNNNISIGNIIIYHFVYF